MFSVSEPSSSVETENELSDFLRTLVRGGFVPRSDMVEEALGFLDLGASAWGPRTELLLDTIWNQQLLEQASWPAVTDFDRLQAAVSTLEDSGVVVRQNFTCCGTCASHEIWEEIVEQVERGRAINGYAYFHMQDTDRAVEGGGLCFGYGAVGSPDDGYRAPNEPEASVAVGHRIQEALEKQGLRTEWSGTIERRVAVALDWKRRLPAEDLETMARGQTSEGDTP